MQRPKSVGHAGPGDDALTTKYPCGDVHADVTVLVLGNTHAFFVCWLDELKQALDAHSLALSVVNGSFRVTPPPRSVCCAAPKCALSLLGAANACATATSRVTDNHAPSNLHPLVNGYPSRVQVGQGHDVQADYWAGYQSNAAKHSTVCLVRSQGEGCVMWGLAARRNLEHCMQLPNL
jgi:hypothetical protein